MKIKKIFAAFALAILLTSAAAFPAFAQILPSPAQPADCVETTGAINPAVKTALENEETFKRDVVSNPALKSKYLGCAIRFGKISMWMIPYFVVYLIEFLLGIAGLIAVLFMVVGGYYYVVGGVSEEKEKGKKTMQHALIGLVVALSAWMLVNLVQVALTS